MRMPAQQPRVRGSAAASQPRPAAKAATCDLEHIGSRDTGDQRVSKLQVSVRTVEGHTYRACIKLDVSDREDLTAIVSGSLQSSNGKKGATRFTGHARVSAQATWVTSGR